MQVVVFCGARGVSARGGRGALLDVAILFSLSDSSLTHLSSKELFGGLCEGIGVASLSLLALSQGRTLDDGSTSVEDEDGLDAVVEKLSDAPKETEDVRVGKGSAFFIAHGQLAEVIDELAVLIDPRGAQADNW